MTPLRRRQSTETASSRSRSRDGVVGCRFASCAGKRSSLVRAGLIRAEAFTPSTVSALYKALEDFGAQHRNKDMWIAQLAKGRSAAGGAGGLTLPVVRRPGSWVLGVGLMQIDPALPDGIDSVNRDLFFP